MDRTSWLDEQRRKTEADFDQLAPSYDTDDVEITPTHRRFVSTLLERAPANGRVLDAACGTGKYFAMIVATGRELVGVDQSAGMLAEAHAGHPQAHTEPMGLQELTFVDEFDCVICVDAMENVFPEDWPLVIGNLRRALRPGGFAYLTVETKDERAISEAFTEATAQDLPVVFGEHVVHGYYHYYPPIPQVRTWVKDAGFDVVEEGQSQGDGYGYHHLLAQARVPETATR
jgi:ubiquinone/menaquinone biosynthesis C-methylase UbiE